MRLFFNGEIWFFQVFADGALRSAVLATRATVEASYYGRTEKLGYPKASQWCFQPFRNGRLFQSSVHDHRKKKLPLAFSKLKSVVLEMELKLVVFEKSVGSGISLQLFFEMKKNWGE